MLFKGTYCQANHIFGGDLLYTNILNDSTYVVKLTLYGDCSVLNNGGANLISDLYAAVPRVELFKSGAFMDTLFLKLLPGSGDNVSPICPSMLSQSSCNAGTLPGILRFIYTDTVVLHFKSSAIRFVFNGNMLGVVSHAGRSSNITNIVGAPNTSVIELEADLNNVNGSNSSPQYSTIPTPFYCINIPEQYNQGAADPNIDSLSFSLVNGIDANTGSNVNYIGSFTPTHPLATGAGGFYFNPVNGQMSFTGNITQEALVVNRVSEYRGGVLVGTSEREMTFIFQDNCTGATPEPYIANLSGATVTNGTIINICKNTPHVSFNIDLTNPDGDTSYITPGNVPPSATLTVNNNGTPNAGITFNWNTDTLSTGVYTFYLNIKSDHCPIYFTQTIAYTINVANPPTITDTIISATQCVHGAAVQFNLTQGFVPRKVTITQGTTVINTVIDSTGTTASGVVIDSLPAGTYTATVSSDSLCTASVSFTVIDSGALPHINGDESLCRYENADPINIPLDGPSATISWFSTAGVPLLGAPLPNTFTTGSYSWYFIENYRSCTTGPDTVHVVVHDLPVVAILNIPHTVCYGDEIHLEASGGIKYTWQPADIIRSDTSGQYVLIYSPVTLTVTATDANSCIDTATVTYSDIPPCCNFSYPTAFTPNNDGNNDGFRIVTYGNMLHYSLSIYNRWGQKVFWTGDPDRRWDGGFEGHPCDAGVYYYIMQGQCLTGQKQEHRGDLTLIR